PFTVEEAPAFWLGMDTLCAVDRELRTVDTLLAEAGRPRLPARGVACGGAPGRAGARRAGRRESDPARVLPAGRGVDAGGHAGARDGHPVARGAARRDAARRERRVDAAARARAERGER